MMTTGSVFRLAWLLCLPRGSRPQQLMCLILEQGRCAYANTHGSADTANKRFRGLRRNKHYRAEDDLSF